MNTSDIENTENTEFSTNDEVLVEAPLNLITDHTEITRALEAIIFASPKSISLLRIKNLLTAYQYDVSSVPEILEEMAQTYEARGFQLQKVAGGYQFRTHPTCSDLLQKLLEDKPARIGRSALEVLSVIAYKQPMTRSEIDAIRGVDSGHLMKGLLDKNLIRPMGHAETPGRPLLYGTTPYFLEVFSLGSLDDLPSIEEFDRELKTADATLAAEPGYEGPSPLAAEPDRGNFDEPASEEILLPDFGSHDTGGSDDSEETQANEQHA